MKSYRLRDDFTDRDAERALIACLLHQPSILTDLSDFFSHEIFVCESETWLQVTAALKSGSSCELPAGWEASADPRTTAHRLLELCHYRQLADIQEDVAEKLHRNVPAHEVLNFFEDRLPVVRPLVQMSAPQSRPLWGSEIAQKVLDDAKDRQTRRIVGLPLLASVSSGLRGLDGIIGGFRPGLHITAGGPGVGKTTIELQFAMEAAGQGVPALYVTYENPAADLVLKAICAHGKINSKDVESGRCDLDRLHRAFSEIELALHRLALVEGSSQLTVNHVEAMARSVMKQHGTSQCVIVFDYLQRAAHSLGYEQLRHNVSALSGQLRDLANRLHCPVLAISSQNRARGGYGNHSGTANLDSLKESGDLEYSADTLMFLVPAEKRLAVPPARALDLMVAKNRFGDVGCVHLIFLPQSGLMREEAKE